MALLCFLFLLPLVYCNAVNGAFAIVDCKPESTGQYGQNTLLECIVRTTQVQDPQILMVVWKKEGVKDSLLYFRRGNAHTAKGYSLAEPSWKKTNMNVSLLIANTSVQHDGSYTCDVLTSGGKAELVRTRLTVTAKYSEPTIVSRPEKITRDTDSTLECKSYGGYPRGQLRWFDGENNKLTSGVVDHVRTTDAGLFNLYSNLTLKAGQVSSPYTCVMTNSSGGKDGEARIEIPDVPKSEGVGDKKPQSATKVVAPLVIIGSLIVGLLLVLLLRRMRSRRNPEFDRVDEPDLTLGLPDDRQENDPTYRDNLA